LLKGLKEQGRNLFLAVELDPHFGKLSFEWLNHHGRLRLRFYDTDSLSDVYEEVMFSRDVRNRLLVADPALLVETCKAIDTMVKRMMINIRQRNGYRYCDCPTHESIKGLVVPDVCYPVGDKWVCDACIKTYSLMYENPAPKRETKADRTERQKMNAGLRFSILERDGFKCRACGRSPREHNIKLHVDHIVPIAKGGLTEPRNLHTLCQDCNSGKSDKLVAEMEGWNE
jgi:hypothetical protein